MTRRFRPSDLRFLAALALPAGLLFNLRVQPTHVGWSALAIWALVAGADALVPGSQRSPGPGGHEGFLLGILRLYVPLQVLLVALALPVAQAGDWALVAGLAVGVGFATGAQGITFAHELGHSRQRADRLLGWVLMTSVCYPQFMVEHYRGHHVRVATNADPASSRRGESLWRFLPRTLAGSFWHAWQLERLRLADRGRSWLASPLAWASSINLACIVLLAGLGWYQALLFWLAQSAFAVWLLETVNYIEHYGLRRAENERGQREPFGVEHAWNADHVVSNSLLANLQRHSDHHMHAWKPYPALAALPGPQLPTGYAGCLLLAAIPPLWFSLMEPRLANWQRMDPAARAAQPQVL